MGDPTASGSVVIGLAGLESLLVGLRDQGYRVLGPTVHDGAIGYDEAGSGAAIPIVFLHGVGSDKSVWRPQLDHFSATRRAVVAPGRLPEGP